MNRVSAYKFGAGYITGSISNTTGNIIWVTRDHDEMREMCRTALMSFGIIKWKEISKEMLGEDPKYVRLDEEKKRMITRIDSVTDVHTRHKQVAVIQVM